MKLTEIPYSSPLYREELELRNALLRRPLGLDVFAEDLAGEAGYRHFGLLDGARLLACLTVVPRGEGLVQIRHVAVRANAQRSGLGRILMTGVEGILRDGGTVSRIYLNSRTTATGFYHKLGYHAVGAEFPSMGITHQRMEKALAS